MSRLFDAKNWDSIPADTIIKLANDYIANRVELGFLTRNQMIAALILIAKDSVAIGGPLYIALEARSAMSFNELVNITIPYFKKRTFNAAEISGLVPLLPGVLPSFGIPPFPPSDPGAFIQAPRGLPLPGEPYAGLPFPNVPVKRVPPIGFPPPSGALPSVGIQRLYDEREWSRLPDERLNALAQKYITNGFFVNHQQRAAAMARFAQAQFTPNTIHKIDIYKNHSFPDLVTTLLSFAKPMDLPTRGSLPSSITTLPDEILPLERPRYMYDAHSFTAAGVNVYLQKIKMVPNIKAFNSILATKTFGMFSASDLLYIYQVPANILYTGNRYTPTPLAERQILLRAKADLDKYAQLQALMAVQVAKGKSAAELRAEPVFGVYTTTIQGLPFLEYLGDGLIQGGIGGLALPQAFMVRSIHSIPIQVWSSVYTETLTDQQIRNLSYIISHSTVKPMVSPGLTATDVPLKMFGYVLNLPEILQDRFIEDQLHHQGNFNDRTWKNLLNTIRPQHNVSEGGRQALLRWINSDPVGKTLALPTTYPFYVEDYIPGEVWDRVPQNIKITGVSGMELKVIENPYSIIPDFPRFDMTAYREASGLEFEQAETGLYELDRAEPSYILTILTDPDPTHLSWERAEYFLAARGIMLGFYQHHGGNAPPNMSLVYRVVLGIQDAGGLGHDVKDARPNTPDFLFDAISRLEPSHIEIIAKTCFLPTPQAILHTDDIKRLCTGQGIPDYELVTPAVLQEIVNRGYINPLPLSKRVAERYVLWNKTTPLQRAMLDRLYNGNLSVVTFTSKRPDPKSIEYYILAYSEENLSLIKRNLEIQTPYNMTDADYVTRNLHLYDAYMHHPPGTPIADTEQLSDIALLRSIGAWVAYSSRPELLTEVEHLYRGGTGFFVPFGAIYDYKTSDGTIQHFMRKCKNSTSSDLVTEMNDPGTFIIAYGTLASYYCYTLDEIQAALIPTEEAKAYVYRLYRPVTNEDTTGGYINVPPQLFRQARTLIEFFMSRMKPDQLEVAHDVIASITRIDDVFEKGTKYDKEQFEIFTKWPMNVRPLLKTLFRQIFEVGMYARRWKGPPNPYPLTDKETLVDQCFIPEVATAEPLARLNETIRTLGGAPEQKEIDPKSKQVIKITPEAKGVSPEALEWAMNLRMVEHREGSTMQSADRPFKDIFEKQYGKERGHTCIRIGSTVMVGTGAYYLELFFKEPIPDYDPKRLEKIA